MPRKYTKRKKYDKNHEQSLGLRLVQIAIFLIICAIGWGLLQVEPIRAALAQIPYLEEYFKDNNDIEVVPEGMLEVHFIDVGQGDACLIKTDKGNIMIDCGPSDSKNAVLEYLDLFDVDTLEYLIFTHPHEDHMGEAPDLLENVKVNNIIMNDRISTTKYFKETLDLIDSLGINTIIPEPKDYYVLSGLKLTVLGPYREKFSDEDTNNSSLILLAEFGERSFLFTGDAEHPAIEDLLKYHKNDIDCDVYSAGHHGSDTSNPMSLLKAMTPEYIVISAGRDNEYGHPIQSVLDDYDKIGAQYFITYEDGDVYFLTDGTTLERKFVRNP